MTGYVHGEELEEFEEKNDFQSQATKFRISTEVGDLIDFGSLMHQNMESYSGSTLDFGGSVKRGNEYQDQDHQNKLKTPNKEIFK